VPLSRPSNLIIQEEGVTTSNQAHILNLVGAGATASGSGATATITIPGATYSGIDINLPAPSGGDDQPALQAAINGSNPWDRLWFRGATYQLARPLVRKSNRSYRGAIEWGDGTILKAMDGSSANFQHANGHSGVFVSEGWDSDATTAVGVEEILNITVHGNKTNNATGQHHGFVLYGDYWSHYAGLRAHSCKRSGIHLTDRSKGNAAMGSTISDGRFRNIFCHDNDEHGIYQRQAGANNNQDMVWDGDLLCFDNLKSGVWIDNAGGWKFPGNVQCSGVREHGFYVLSSSYGMIIAHLYVWNFGLLNAAGTTYFGLRLPCKAGRGAQVNSATIATATGGAEPAGTATFVCYDFSADEDGGSIQVSNAEAIGGNTARGHGFVFNAGSGLTLRVGQTNLQAKNFVAGQAKELLGLGSLAFDPPLHLTATATWDPPSMANGAIQTTTVTVPGARPGDLAVAGHTAMPTGAWELSAQVTATDTVTVSLRNSTGGTINPDTGTLRVTVWRH
jgi:hypothetical protein